MARNVTAQMTGEQKLRRTLRWYERRYPDALDGALYKKGEEIMAESVKECPVKVGILRRSARTEKLENHTVQIGYGTNYAEHVHERTEIRHTAPTKAKFLEDPLKRHASQWLQDVVALARGLVRAGRGFGGRGR